MDIAMNKIDIYIFDERLHSWPLENIQYSIYKEGHTDMHTAANRCPRERFKWVYVSSTFHK